MPGPFELVIILAIVILIFGGKRLKNLGSDLGGAINKGFKSSVKEAETEEEETIEVEVEETDDHNEPEIEASDDTSEENSEK